MAEDISLIVAIDRNGVIGCGEKLPWNEPEDMRSFWQKTYKCAVIMGSNTHRAIGKVLSDRFNVVMTKKQPADDIRRVGEIFKQGKAFYADSVATAVKAARESYVYGMYAKHTYIIGGASVYKEFIPFADALRMTRFNYAVEDGDTFFNPEVPINFEDKRIFDWELLAMPKMKTSDGHFCIYRRKRNFLNIFTDDGSYVYESGKTVSKFNVDGFIKLLKEKPEIVDYLHAGLGLVTEAAEFADNLKRMIYYGAEFDKVNALEELGDIRWYMAMMERSLGTNLDKIEKINLAKLRTRYPDKFTAKNALDRDIGKERVVLEKGSGND